MLRFDFAGEDTDADDVLVFPFSLRVGGDLSNTQIAAQLLPPIARVLDPQVSVAQTLENVVRNVLVALIVASAPPDLLARFPPELPHRLAQQEGFLCPYAAVARWLVLEAKLPDNWPVAQEQMEAFFHQRFDDETWDAFLANPTLDRWVFHLEALNTDHDEDALKVTLGILADDETKGNELWH